MSFLRGGDSGENSLVVDISSGSVGAALVRSSKRGVPEIICQTRTPFAAVSESAMLPALRASLVEITQSAPVLKAKGFRSSIDKAIITLSSPWLATHLKTVIISKEEKFVFDRHALEKVMNEEKELFLSKLAQDYEEESAVFESAVTSLFLNGYEVALPSKSRVNRVEASFIMSATVKSLQRKIEDEIIKAVGLRRGAAFQSFMYAFYKVLSHAFQSLHSGLIMNMGQELTDILYLRHGSSALSASIPFGPSAVVKDISLKLDVPPQIAESYLRLFSSGVLDEATVSGLESILSETEEKWKSQWRSMGEEIPEGGNVPHPVYLIAPAGFGKFTKVFLENIFDMRQVVLIGETNGFTRELVSIPPQAEPDEGLMVLSSFSNLIS